MGENMVTITSMKKLIKGIIEFRKNAKNDQKDKFRRLANNQAPDTLFVACSDSRVVPNTFASTEPGDLFVIRNVGNLIPEFHEQTEPLSCDESETAAIEFAINKLNVIDIVICGHSDCGAMHALINDRSKIRDGFLKSWLRHGDGALRKFNDGMVLDSSLDRHNQLSQINVLQQIQNIKTYPIVADRIAKNKIAVHGWWFDIQNAEVYCYDQDQNKFVLIDE